MALNNNINTMRDWVAKTAKPGQLVPNTAPKDKINPNTTYDNYNELAQGAAGYHANPAPAEQLRANNDFQSLVQSLLPNYNPGGAAAGASAAVSHAAQLKALSGQVTGAVSADRNASHDAYAQLDQYLSQLSNPYKSIAPAQQAQVDPTALANLLQSQGADSAGLRAQAQFLQAQNGAQAGASDRLAQMLAAAQDSWNQSSRTAGKLQGQQADAELTAQLLQLQAALASRGG